MTLPDTKTQNHNVEKGTVQMYTPHDEISCSAANSGGGGTRCKELLKVNVSKFILQKFGDRGKC